MARPDATTKLPYRDEVRRKALHLLALVVPLGMALLGRTLALAVLLPSAALAVTADVLRARSHAFASWIYRVFGSMMRAEERPAVRPDGERGAGTAPLILNGATWVLITAALLALLFPLTYAVPAFAMFMVADAAAALVGRRLGRHRWPYSDRTLEGSAAFLVVALAVLACFPAVSWPAAAAAALSGALAEVPTAPLNDNVRVPLVAAGTLWVIDALLLA